MGQYSTLRARRPGRRLVRLRVFSAARLAVPAAGVDGGALLPGERHSRAARGARVPPVLPALLSDVRIYALRQELAPALVPALALALTALAFELLGRAFRGRADLP